MSNLIAITYHGPVGVVRFLQEPGTSTGPAGEQSPGPMIDDFFASNPWLTSAMAGIGVLLVAFLIIKAIWQSKDDGKSKALGSAIRGALFALLLFVPSLIGKLADLGFTAITSLADWFFELLG
ncbi:MAG TPA: hypothetical protein VFI47_21095 [Acidimicrobiales bacterium]|nr:hypothetical protein [Acidimicrobiales bacterium]